MSKVSKAFGKLISDFMKRNSLTFRAAALQTSVSAAYWKDMSDGRVPSEDIIARISACFEDLDENPLRMAAGYAPKMEKMAAVKAVEFALRGNDKIPAQGKRQIIEFVKEMEERYAKKGKK